MRRWLESRPPCRFRPPPPMHPLRIIPPTIPSFIPRAETANRCRAAYSQFCFGARSSLTENLRINPLRLHCCVEPPLARHQLHPGSTSLEAGSSVLRPHASICHVNTWGRVFDSAMYLCLLSIVVPRMSRLPPIISLASSHLRPRVLTTTPWACSGGRPQSLP